MPTTVNQTFRYTGAVQTFQFPWNITGTITVILLGASGENHDSPGSGLPKTWGGLGGRVLVDLDATVYRGKTIYLYVGGKGSSVNGGFNGGGDGHDSANTFSGNAGGGATDIRVDGTALSNRILVAAGGGGASAGHDGGDGGVSVGQAGADSFVGGQGGSLTAGGSGGPKDGAAASNGSDGVLGHGGHGGWVSSSGSNGGGGGGGYYGGGGGGSSIANFYGGGGGGGSNFIAAYPAIQTVTLNQRGQGSQDSDGSVTFSYTVADPVSGGVSMGGSGSLGANPFVSHPVSLPVLASARLTASAIVFTREAIAARATLTTARGTESIFGNNTLLAARATLAIAGLRSTTSASAFLVSGGLTIQQTAVTELFQVRAVLALPTSQRTLFAAVTIPATARLLVTGRDTQARALALVARGSLSSLVFREVLGGVTVASHGAVSLAGRLSEQNGVLMYPHASLALTGRSTVIGQAQISVLARLASQIQLRHDMKLELAASTTLSVTPSVIVFVGPSMSAYAELDLSSLVVGSPIHLGALAAMLIDLDPSGGIYDAPYRVITDIHNTVKFFVRGYPRPGQVRQAVTNVHSGF